MHKINIEICTQAALMTSGGYFILKATKPEYNPFLSLAFVFVASIKSPSFTLTPKEFLALGGHEDTDYTYKVCASGCNFRQKITLWMPSS